MPDPDDDRRAAAGDDLNGLTLGGVGSATTIDNVQVHNSGDDGIEVFGGSVNLKHAVITGALDDSLDCDYAWTGNVQFLVVKQTAITGGPDGLMECSNAPKNSVGGALLTRPTISNFTFVGLPTSSTGSNLKGIGIDASAGLPGASAVMVNGVVTGATRCLSVVEPETGSGRGSANTTTPPSFNSVLFDCVSQPSTTVIPGSTVSASSIIAAGTNNSTTVANTLASGVFQQAVKTLDQAGADAAKKAIVAARALAAKSTPKAGGTIGSSAPETTARGAFSGRKAGGEVSA